MAILGAMLFVGRYELPGCQGLGIKKALLLASASGNAFRGVFIVYHGMNIKHTFSGH